MNELLETWRPRRPFFAGVFLFGLILWTFLPAIDGGFVGYDDPDYVSANARVQQGLTGESLRWAFSSSEAANWHPLTWISHMLDCQVFGAAAWGHHLTSLLLHALNTLLVFVVLRRSTGATGRSFIVALLFGLHPLRVESVAWVSERKDVLSGFFFMLTLWAWLRYAEKSEIRNPKAEVRGTGNHASPTPGTHHASRIRHHASSFYLVALLFYAMGLMSKPMLVTAPCLLLLLDYWPLRRWGRRSWRDLVLEKVPFFAASLVLSVITIAVQKRGGAMVASLPLAARLENVPVSYCRYLGKLFWPADLAAFYPPVAHWSGTVVIMAGLLLVGLSVAAVVFRGRFPYGLTGWFWFFGALVPVIGLVPAGEQSLADRYSYIPSIGIILLVVWGLHDLTRRWRWQVPAASAATAGAAFTCLMLTRAQVGCWKNTEALFRHALLVTERNYLAHNNVGAALDRQGRGDEALSEFRRALEIKPDYPEALNNLGAALNRQGHLDEAVSRFREALRLRPGYAEARYNLGTALQAQGQLDEAISHYQQALRLKPQYADAHYNLALVFQRQGNLDPAIAEFQAVLKLQPQSPEVCNNLGVALEGKGQLDDAISQYAAALRLNPDYARAHFNLGVALGRKGQLEQAIAEFEQTLRLDPAYGAARTNLAVIRGLKGSLK